MAREPATGARKNMRNTLWALDEARQLFGAAADPFVRDKIAQLSAELAQHT